MIRKTTVNYSFRASFWHNHWISVTARVPCSRNRGEESPQEFVHKHSRERGQGQGTLSVKAVVFSQLEYNVLQTCA